MRIHETPIYAFLGSKRWDLFLSQIKLAQKQGLKATDLYHLMDRMPGEIRKELHEVFRRSGGLVDEPQFKRHVNPADVWRAIAEKNDPATEDYKPMKFVNRVLEKAAASPVDEEEISAQSQAEIQAKREFLRQFKTSSGMDLFSKTFIPDDEQSVPGVTFDSGDEVNDGDKSLLDENPSGVMLSSARSDIKRGSLASIRQSLK